VAHESSLVHAAFNGGVDSIQSSTSENSIGAGLRDAVRAEQLKQLK
jgi:hypothetical protein